MRDYRIGELLLQCQKRRLLDASGQALPVSARAYDVLLHLVENRQRVVGKDELLKAGWPSTIVEENNLNQAIASLRRVLRDSREAPRYIATIAGRGYQFVGDVAVLEPPDATTVSASPPATQPAAAAAPTHVSRRALVISAATAGTLALAGGAWWWRSHARVGPPRSIAVLPFRPLLPDSRDPALELGVTELLVNRLSRLPGLVVAPLSSVMRFASRDVDPLDAGSELGVDAIVDGHLSVHDQRVRLTARLLAVDGGASLWANTFTEPLGELLAVQDALALQLADAITAQLSEEARSRVVAGGTADVDAWQLYANGRLLVDRRDANSLRQAIALFEQARRRDPRFAQANAGLAHAHVLTAIFLIEPPARAFVPAREAALRAIELDPKLPDGHISLGHVITEFDRDLEAARRHFAHALKLKPGSASALAQLAMNQTQAGNLAGARESIQAAQMLEPSHYAYLSLSGFIRYFERAYDDSERELRQIVQTVPQGALARHFLAYTLLIRGKGAEVLQLLDPGNENAPTAYGNRARALVQTGNAIAARREIDRLERLGAQGFGVDYSLATVHVELGEHDRALARLEHATREAQMLGYLNVDPALDPIRHHARFRAVAQRLRLA